MVETKTYEVDGLTFEFSPSGSPYEGLLMVSCPEGTFSSHMNLTKLRSRAAWAKEMAELYGADAARLKRALNELCTLRSEEVAAAAAEGDETTDEAGPPVPVGTERHEEAMKLLRCPDLLEEAANDMERLGHVGERGAKKLAFTCGLSARSGQPIQPSTHAQSSAGKNALWDVALALFPEEMVVRRSGLSAKALFRTQTNLKGAVLYLQEVAGSDEAEYSIRVMQSDGGLTYEATEKAPDGSLKNVVHQTEGPTVIVQTTTRNHLHPENESRVLPIYIDESEQQTKRIVASILKDAAGAGLSAAEREHIRGRWHDTIRLLEPAEVVIPYAERIKVPNSPIRIRRDARRLVDVVRVIAWLHQHRRERDADGRILAAEEDFYAALSLVSESLRRAWQALTPAEETVLKAINSLSDRLRKKGFRRRDLKVGGVSDRRVKEALRSLTDTGYLDCDERKGPQGFLYTVAREAETLSLGISLRPSPDGYEAPARGEDPTGRPTPARCRPMPDVREDDNGYREAGVTGRNGRRPIEGVDLQEECATGRTGEEDEEAKVESGSTRSGPPTNDYHGSAEDLTYEAANVPDEGSRKGLIDPESGGSRDGRDKGGRP